MLRAFFRRLTQGRDAAQLEMVFSGKDRPSRIANSEPPITQRLRETEALLARLRALGLTGNTRLILTRNAAVMVSSRGQTLRVHEAFREAPDDTLRAIVVFVCGRGVARWVARRSILDFPIPGNRQRRRRPEPQHPDDASLSTRLLAEHARINQEQFAGTLSVIPIRVSRRLKSRLGHYAPASTHGSAEIAISRRHIRRDGWKRALETLAHEMIHQWQEESGLPVDHGQHFRRKARDVGVSPRARRIVA